MKKSIISFAIISCALSSSAALYSMEKLVVFKRVYFAGNYDPVERNCVLPIAAEFKMDDGSTIIQKLSNSSLPKYQGELLNILYPQHWNVDKISLIYPAPVPCNKTRSTIKVK